MSISAFIPEPADDLERQFHIPVSTEAFFAECWEPAAEELGLRWVPVFSTGIEITKEDLPEVLGELNRLKEWALEQSGGERMKQLVSRIDLLLAESPRALQRDGTAVYIG
ncbi:hypothetical protein LJK87_29630 [Paenibacillus sp. P25]|nr:hypothetical protein LJK87_29630 [Paenibacillus sp. P25]